MTHATKIPWETKVRGPRYGTDDTYRLAATWLAPCHEVADWGGALGHFQTFLSPDVIYHLVDGTDQSGIGEPNAPITVVDLANYAQPCEGILLRHVLEVAPAWRAVLQNAVAAFQQRLVVITCSKRVRVTHVATYHETWAFTHFNHNKDLMPIMAPYLVRFEDIRTRRGGMSWPERVYYLARS